MDVAENRAVPPILKPLFWSNDFSKLDLDKDQEHIVIQTINYGNLTDWKWLIERYGRQRVLFILRKVPATALRERVRRLAGVIFSITDFNYAPRGPR